MSSIYYLDRITTAVPTAFREAVRVAAEARGLSMADFVRGAVQSRMLMDGARFTRLPNLDRRVTSDLQAPVRDT